MSDSSFDPHYTFFNFSSRSCLLIPRDANRSYCTTCDVVVSHSDLRSHFVDGKHMERADSLEKVQIVGRDLSRRHILVEKIMDHLTDLGLEKWRDPVRLKLLNFVMIPNESILPARKLFDKYDLLERVSLLELAVWKIVCQESKPMSAFKYLSDCKSWLTHDWKEVKEEMRHSNSISIILTHVVGFLAVERRPMPMQGYYGW